MQGYLDQQHIETSPPNGKCVCILEYSALRRDSKADQKGALAGLAEVGKASWHKSS